MPAGAPIGNENGKGHGRPPIYDLKVEADALIEWSKRETSLTLNAFANERDYDPEYLSVWAKKDDYFSQALKKAKSRLAVRREMLVHSNKFNYGIFNRYQFLYDPMLREGEREEKAYEASLKKEEDNTAKEIVLKVKYDNRDRAEISAESIPAANIECVKQRNKKGSLGMP